MRDILARDDEIVAAIVDPTQDDVGVRALGVEVVDRDPVELRPHVLLGLRHEAADIRLEVGIFGTVLGRDDEAKLVSAEDRSEEHTSELQSLMRISYAVFCLKKTKNYKTMHMSPIIVICTIAQLYTI